MKLESSKAGEFGLLSSIYADTDIEQAVGNIEIFFYIFFYILNIGYRNIGL